MDKNFKYDTALDRLLSPCGLLLIGSIPVSGEDGVPDIADKLPARQLLLVGNGGSSFWPAFTRSPEFADRLADPLDRWSRRTGNFIAGKIGGRAIFPFEGPPHPPFLSWAAKTRKVAPSRLSLFIHEQFGLWHAYRFALAIPEIHDQSPIAVKYETPCVRCEDQPCLGVCPVNAFSKPYYRADKCIDYLASDDRSPCRKLGCEARRACPVGKTFTYSPEHAAFHMDAFVKSSL